MLPEVVPGRRVDAVGAVPEVDRVQVRREDLRLRVHGALELVREHDLLELPAHGLLGRQVRVLDQLLGDRRAALAPPQRDPVEDGADDALGVEPLVLVEALVLDRDDRVGASAARSGSASAPGAPRPGAGTPIRIQQPFAPARASLARGLLRITRVQVARPARARARRTGRGSGAFCATAVMKPNSEETIASSVSRASTSPNRTQRMRRRRASRGRGGCGGGRELEAERLLVIGVGVCACGMRPGAPDSPRMVPRRGGFAASILPRMRPRRDHRRPASGAGQLFQTTDEERIRARLRGGAGARLLRVRPDGALAPGRQPRAAVRPRAVPAGRPRADRAARRRHRPDRRPARHRRSGR